MCNFYSFGQSSPPAQVFSSDQENTSLPLPAFLTGRKLKCAEVAAGHPNETPCLHLFLAK